MIKRFSILILLIFYLLFSAGADVVLAGATDELLIKSVASNNLNMVKTAIANGANVNTYDAYKQTPLGIAILNKNIDIIKYLISVGANVNLNSISSMSIETPPIGLAVIGKNSEIMKILLEAGADVNSVNKRGDTPLILSFLDPIDMGTVKILLECKADINKANNYDMTPLMVIANDRGNRLNNNVEKRIAIAKAFLQYGADPNRTNNNMETALDLAKSNKFVDMINLLSPVTDIKK